MFDDKWKAKNALCKAYKLYYKKKEPYLKADTIDLYDQLLDIQHAIAYVLCEYFDFNYEFYYDVFPFNYKWSIAWDYIKYYDECKKAYEKFVKEQKQYEQKQNDFIRKLGDIIERQKHVCTAWSTDDFKSNYSKGDTIYNMENGCIYFYDGKKFINMC